MPKRRSNPELIAALAPASGHLLAAAVELIAAARAALDALTEDGAGLPAKSVEALRSARGSLDLLASLAATGAEASRQKAKETARREALDEILAALDARAETLSGPAGEAFAAVRDAVASASGSPKPRHERVTKKKKKARGKLRRIPIVLDHGAEED